MSARELTLGTAMQSRVKTVVNVTSALPSPYYQRDFSSRVSGNGKNDDRPKDRASLALQSVSVTDFPTCCS